MEEQPLNNKSVTGGTGITAGNDVSIGDVTGQLSIGEYINQFMIKEPSGEAMVKLIDFLEHKRKEELNLKISNSYNPSALPDYSPELKKFVTTNRVEELNKSLMYLQNHRILLFTGMGGIGKTTLARALIDIRPTNVPIPFWFDFNVNQSARLEDILVKLSSYLDSPDLVGFREEKREPEKKDIDKLTDKLKIRNPLWLIFDNLETIMDDVNFHDKNMDLFFTCLCNSTHQAKIIITSRTFPELKNGECLIDVIEGEKQDIKGLKTNFAVEYLAKNGLANIELYKLEKLAKGADGHPLALKLLVKLVKEFGDKDILEDLSIYQEQKQNTILKARRFFNKLVGNEKALLERISVYREPVKIKGLKEMFMEKTSTQEIQKLINKSLLETDHNGNYWLHPLVQEFSYDDLKNKNKVHKLAVEYYLSLSIPGRSSKKEDIQSLIEAHYHACMAEEYDQAFNIIFNTNLYEYLDLWGNYTVLIDLYSKLLPRNHFGKETLLKNKINHSAILGNMGLAYSSLGELRKAIKYYEQALSIAREIGEKCEEGNRLGNLGKAYYDLGDRKKAIEYLEEALNIFREIGERRGEGRHLGSMAVAYVDIGESKKAIEYLEEALNITREIREKRGEGIYLGNLGSVYYLLGKLNKTIEYYNQALRIAREIGDRHGEGQHLGNMALTYSELGEPKKAIEYFKEALNITREIGERRIEGHYLGHLGAAYRYLGEPKKSIGYSEEALSILREIGDKPGEVANLGYIGLAYDAMGEPKKAIKYYEQALKIARESRYKYEQAYILGGLALTYRNMGEPKKAIECYEQALKIVREIGDKRGEGHHLGNMGLAYSDLGESKKAIEFLKESLAIGKVIEDPRIINFCEKELKDLKGFNE